MGTELVRATRELAEPDSPESVARIEAMKDKLPSLIQAGDIETIKRWRDEGKAASLAAKKMGYEREGAALARQAIRCAAALGMIEVREGVWGKEKSIRFRAVLAAAMDRGRLEAVLDALGAPTVNEQTVARAAMAMGMSGVNRAAVVRRVRAKLNERGESLEKVSLRTGHSKAWLSCFLRERADRPRADWWATRRLTDALDIDIRDLAPVGQNRRPLKKRPYKWLTHRFAPGKGRWDEVGVRMIAMRDEMSRADSAWSDKPLLYEAMKTLSDIIQKEIRAAEK